MTGGCELDGAYRFSSLTIKGLERRLDGILEPEGHSGPAYVVQFQGQHLASAWYNLLTKIERFRDLSAKEIWAMLNALTPLEETHAYQSIYDEGKTDGITEGKAEGKSDALEGLLAHRFGPLPGWASTRITAASIDQLDAWLDGIFDAESLEALIGSKTQC